MPITHDYLKNDNILLTVATGEVTRADGAELNRHVSAVASENPGLKVLVDTRAAQYIATPAQVIAQLEVFYELVGPTIPVALLLQGNPANPNPMLAETQAYINGAQMRVFDDRDSALGWLRSIQAGAVARPANRD